MDDHENISHSDHADKPLADLTGAALRQMLKLAKQRGYVTHAELSNVLPSEDFSSEQIEDVLSQLSQQGINVVESEETEEEAADGGDLVEASETRAVAVFETTTKEPTDRTDDPARMYLREMGSVQLLSREGEIAIAKRIEAGREAMIAGLCESPLTFQAIIIWRDELVEGKVLLRHIIDLGATYAGPDANGAPKANALGEGEGEAEEETAEGEEAAPSEEAADDDMENNVSLSAMEAELKPRVL
ncbi:RNA polymerase sigma factor RpoD, partial [Microvirga sp. HBU67558]